MSAYSDWKCGALSDSEFRSAMARECADYDDRPSCSECVYYHDGKCQVDECYGVTTKLTYGEMTDIFKQLSYVLRDDKPDELEQVWKNMAIIALENAWEYFDGYEPDKKFEE